MATPYADITDLLALTATSFECVEGDSPQRSGDSALIRNKSGQMLQVDTRMTEIKRNHKYHLLEDDPTLPARGAHTGLSSVVYWIDDVNVDKPEGGHHSMTVTFRRWEDVASSVYTGARADLNT